MKAEDENCVVNIANNVARWFTTQRIEAVRSRGNWSIILDTGSVDTAKIVAPVMDGMLTSPEYKQWANGGWQRKPFKSVIRARQHGKYITVKLFGRFRS